MTEHPYRQLHDRAFWSRAVAAGLDAHDLVARDQPLLRRSDWIASIGSCFASNLVPHIEAAGFHYLRTEVPPGQVAHLPENLGYRKFSAAYGNVYTVRQMRQLVLRSIGEFSPIEDRWYADGAVIDPFRPGLAYPAANDLEFDLLTKSHLAATRAVFETATVTVMTLGLTEAWESSLDHAVYPSCPGTIGGDFDPQRHQFVNFDVTSTISDLHGLIAAIRSINPTIRFILTVSPVPLVATASGRHVLEATIYSKSVLRAAAGAIEASDPGVTYFPAYEIVTGPQAPHDTFEADRRSVSSAAIEYVMTALLAASEHPTGEDVNAPAADPGSRQRANQLSELSRSIVNAECDEELLDRPAR